MYRRPPGVGDKSVLRGVASALGLHSCQSLVKRAIQFGSRVAREHANVQLAAVGERGGHKKRGEQQLVL